MSQKTVLLRNISFLKTFISSIQISTEEFEIVPLNGKDTLHLAANQFAQNTALGGVNLIIFDADSQENLGGFQKRRKEIEEKLISLNISADIFLWPDNCHDGDFETMLECVARKDLHGLFFDCFNDYEQCVGKKYKCPNRKGKLHTYITSMNLSNKQRRNIGSGDWLFDDNSFWNLNSSVLDSLKNFLNRYSQHPE